MSLSLVSKTFLTSSLPHSRCITALSCLTQERNLHVKTRLFQPGQKCFPVENIPNSNKCHKSFSIWKRCKSFTSKMFNTHPQKSWCSFSDFAEKNLSEETVSDLRRFLSEVGTDPREARFWLKHFSAVESNKPFAIFQIDPLLLKSPQQLEILSSSLSFLHRNNMKPVIVFGSRLESDQITSAEDFQRLKSKTVLDMTRLTSLLEFHGVQARPLFGGSGLVQAEDDEEKQYFGNISNINTDLVQWCLLTKHIPIISSLGETSGGQTVILDLWSLTDELSKVLKPLKVMKININGGFVNEQKKVIANVNLPADLESCEKKPWFTEDVQKKTRDIYDLLCSMPSESSVVITSVNNLLKELFTHRGSGTFFKITEPIYTYKSFDDIDVHRLTDLFNSSFQKDLKDSYLNLIEDQIDRIYLSKNYNAAAIILHDESNIPYLCKLGVSGKAQGEGTGDMLWDAIRKDYQQLYWRSRIDNVINSWYFKKSEGSWTNGKWTVFWFGVSNPSLSTVLINTALNKQTSFKVPSQKVAV